MTPEQEAMIMGHFNHVTVMVDRQGASMPDHRRRGTRKGNNPILVSGGSWVKFRTDFGEQK